MKDLVDKMQIHLDKYTIKMMSKFGIDNVRGGTFCKFNLSDEEIIIIKKTIPINGIFTCNKSYIRINIINSENIKLELLNSSKVGIVKKLELMCLKELIFKIYEIQYILDINNKGWSVDCRQVEKPPMFVLKNGQIVSVVGHPDGTNNFIAEVILPFKGFDCELKGDCRFPKR
jgi:hypothetical protein